MKFKKLKRWYVPVSVLLIMLSLLISYTYAVYQKEDEITFVNAKVRFPDASEVTYTNSSNSNVTNVAEALTDLYEKLGD